MSGCVQVSRLAISRHGVARNRCPLIPQQRNSVPEGRLSLLRHHSFALSEPDRRCSHHSYLRDVPHDRDILDRAALVEFVPDNKELHPWGQ